MFLDLASCIRTVIVLEFSSDPFNAHASLSIACHGQRSLHQRAAQLWPVWRGDNHVGVEGIIGDDADVAIAESVAAALRFAGRRGEEQQRSKESGGSAWWSLTCWVELPFESATGGFSG
jgi:hypothetical protein